MKSMILSLIYIPNRLISSICKTSRFKQILTIIMQNNSFLYNERNVSCIWTSITKQNTAHFSDNQFSLNTLHMINLNNGSHNCPYRINVVFNVLVPSSHKIELSLLQKLSSPFHPKYCKPIFIQSNFILR